MCEIEYNELKWIRKKITLAQVPTFKKGGGETGKGRKKNLFGAFEAAVITEKSDDGIEQLFEGGG